MARGDHGDRARKRRTLRDVTLPCCDLLMQILLRFDPIQRLLIRLDPGYNKPYQSGIIRTRDCGNDPVATPINVYSQNLSRKQ